MCRSELHGTFLKKVLAGLSQVLVGNKVSVLFQPSSIENILSLPGIITIQKELLHFKCGVFHAKAFSFSKQLLLLHKSEKVLAMPPF